MVQLPDATNLNQSAFARRHTDSPKLWFGVAIGSIAAHLALLSIALPLMVRSSANSGNQSQVASTPVELIDIPSTESSSTSLSDGSSAGQPPSAGGANSPNSTSTLSQPSAAQPSISPQVSPSVTPQLTPTPVPSGLFEPDSRPPSRQEPDESVTPTPTPIPTPTPENPAPQNPVPPASQTDETGSDSSAVDDPSNSNSASEAESPGDSLADSGNSTESETATPPNASGADDPALPEVGVSQEATPSSFTATLSHSALPESQRGDIHDQLPVPKTSVRPFAYDPSAPDASACVVSPESLRDFGQVVSMQVVVESDGTVSDAFIRDADPRISSAYQDLAQCLVKNWSFEPAVDLDPDTNQPVPVADDSLVVSIQISWQ